MSEKNKFRNNRPIVRARPKAKPEPTIESRIKNRPELQARRDELTRERLLAMAPAGSIAAAYERVTQEMEDEAYGSPLVGVPAGSPEGEPAGVGLPTGAAAGEQRLPIEVVGDAPAADAGAVEPVVEDAGLREVGGPGEPEAAEGDGTEVALETLRHADDAMPFAPVDEVLVEHPEAPLPLGDQDEGA